MCVTGDRVSVNNYMLNKQESISINTNVIRVKDDITCFVIHICLLFSM